MRKDISDEVKFENSRANPFGWSTSELHHCGRKIGTLYCGEPMNFAEGYSFELKKEDEHTTRLVVYWDHAF